MPQLMKLTVVFVMLLPTTPWALSLQQPSIQKAPNIVGTVLRPDGSPAAGAEIAVGSKGNSVFIRNGRFDRKMTSVIVKADGCCPVPA